MDKAPVLIVGGGPVGLTASLLLSRAGVRSLLVERHPGTAIHPKARGINARTMEVFHQQSIAAAIRKAGLPPAHTGFIVWAKTLAGEELERRVPWSRRAQSAEVSPVPACLCAQDDLEPVLRHFAAEEALAELRFNTEMTHFAADDTGVVATLRDSESGATAEIRARYMIAADGAQSRVRRALGIGMLGQENVYDSVNILINADLRPWTAHRPAALYFIENPELRATFLTINAADRWGFLVNPLAAQGFKAADFTPDRAAALVRLAVGVPDLAVNVLGIAPWTASAHVAERYVHGPVFLAGDAAHEMPPTGGFGLNTGVQDVHNLCWKLGLVLRGVAAPALLETYHDERQPVGRAITEQSLTNAISMGRMQQRLENTSARPEYLNEQGMIFGATYASRAVIADGTAPTAVANPVTDYAPSARPGGRAPHVWLEAKGGERCSTIDLVGNGFLLMTAPRGQAWSEAAERAAAATALPIPVVTIGDGRFPDPQYRWRRAYEVDDGGAVLVRPDGYVGWRHRSAAGDPPRVFLDAIAAILGRTQ
ncbi:MAG TPA: FAD-dependent monooxygenase [Stellaceae bacterium]|nr:FAD-dependent monooxygenase [Stellaceae bacterium]